MSEYHCPESCNSCGGKNEITATDTLDGHLLMEAKTKCTMCGFEDYWTHGFFESGSEMESNCKKYSFDHRGEA